MSLRSWLARGLCEKHGDCLERAAGQVFDAEFDLEQVRYETCSAGALEPARTELGWARIATEIVAIAKKVASRPRRRRQR
jgi:hypothetical protein